MDVGSGAVLATSFMNMDIDTTYIIYTFTRTRDHNIADAWHWVRSENRDDGLGHNFLLQTLHYLYFFI